MRSSYASRRQPVSKRNWYWIKAIERDGRMAVLGPYNSEEEANSQGYELLDVPDFQIKKLPTRDLARATHLAQGGRVEDGHLIAPAHLHTRHEAGIQQQRRRKSNQIKKKWRNNGM